MEPKRYTSLERLKPVFILQRYHTPPPLNFIERHYPGSVQPALIKTASSDKYCVFLAASIVFQYVVIKNWYSIITYLCILYLTTMEIKLNYSASSSALNSFH